MLFETPGGIATWHRQTKPALTLKAPKKVKRKKKTTAKFRVLDAGAPVAGAKVKVAGEKGTTGDDGRVKIEIGPFAKKKKKVTARASKAGYTSAKRKIKIKKK